MEIQWIYEEIGYDYADYSESLTELLRNVPSHWEVKYPIVLETLHKDNGVNCWYDHLCEEINIIQMPRINGYT